MKIGILTFQSTNNFGAYLHTIALFKKVVSLGYDCEIIDYNSPELTKRETQDFKFRFSLKGILGYLVCNRVLKKKYSNLAKELRELTTVGPVFTDQDIQESNKRYDAFLVGSDVVWSLRITGNDYNYFLAFANDDKKKIAFSSSIGDIVYDIDVNLIKRYLKRFNSICVRDEEGVDWVKNISGMNARYVCDPTMLLTTHEWDTLLNPTKYRSDYVLVYFSEDKKLMADAKEYANKYNLRLVVINYGFRKLHYNTKKPTSLAEFVGLIKHARALFTASYHGMLFGLYYNVELFYYNRSLKSRMESIASKLGVEDHNGDNFNLKIPPINYIVVNERLESFRGYSVKILTEILKSDDN